MSPLRVPTTDNNSIDSDGFRAEPMAREASILRIASTYLRFRWTVIATTFVVAMLFVTAAMLREPTYSSTVSFMPQVDGGFDNAGVARLAGQFGISVGGGNEGHSPEFYAQIVRSRAILSELLQDSFPVAAATPGTSRRPLGEVLELRGQTSAERRAEALQWLEQAVSSRVTNETGVITISVRTRDPQLSGGIAERIPELVHEFNQGTRQSQAAAERAFVEGRVDDANRSLEAAETALQRFLERNRQFTNSSELMFEHDRLQRQVVMQQQVYTSLVQALEEARIDEIRNTPLITIVEHAEVPIRRDPRRLSLFAVIGMVVGFFLGSVVAFLREFARREGEEQSLDYVEFSSLVSNIKAEFARFRHRRGAATGRGAAR